MKWLGRLLGVDAYIRELQNINDGMFTVNLIRLVDRRWQARLRQKEVEIARLRAVLKEYADPDNWITSAQAVAPGGEPLDYLDVWNLTGDGHELARSALDEEMS